MTDRTQIQTARKLTLNPALTGLACLRCGQLYALDDSRIDSGFGCRICFDVGFPAGLQCLYSQSSQLIVDAEAAGMHRFASRLPFTGFASLGEGATPLVAMPALASELGVAALWVKNEGANPTGSHKDRMSPLAAARAQSAGYKKVVASSSGNAGASLASYAAAAGLECCILAGHDISAPWAEAIQLAGAGLLQVDSHERWPLIQKMAQAENWFAVSNM